MKTEQCARGITVISEYYQVCLQIDRENEESMSEGRNDWEGIGIFYSQHNAHSGLKSLAFATRYRMATSNMLGVQVCTRRSTEQHVCFRGGLE